MLIAAITQSSIRQMQRLFPTENLLFLKYEDYAAENESALAQIYTFLGVAVHPVEPVMANVSQLHSPIAPADRLWLQAAYKEDIRQVEALLGWTCGVPPLGGPV